MVDKVIQTVLTKIQTSYCCPLKLTTVQRCNWSVGYIIWHSLSHLLGASGGEVGLSHPVVLDLK